MSPADQLRAVLSKAGIAPGTTLPSEGIPGATTEYVKTALDGVAKFAVAALAKVDGAGDVSSSFGSDLRSLGVMLIKLADNVDGAATAEKFAKAKLAKAELDAYTAVQTTLTALSSRVWGIQDAFREGDLAKAQAEAKGVVDMLSNVVGMMGSAAPAAAAAAPAKSDKTEVAMTPDTLAAWAGTQVEAAKLEKPEAAQKRLAHLGAVLAVAKATNWENTGGAPEPLPFTMMTAYAPFSGKDGKLEDLTATKDQSVSESAITPPKVSPAATAFSANPTTSPPYSPPGGSAGVEGTSQPGPGQSNFDQGGGVSPLGKSAGGHAWPLDLAGRKGAQFGDELEAEPVAKRDTDDGWGKDPSGLR